MNLPPEQEAIRAKCFHPSAKFVEFPAEDVETSIPERFEKIVRLYPDHFAVKRKEQTVTYDALNRAANRLARRILTQQQPKQEPVALFLEPGISLIVASLGVLKAGKISVFVNPLAPRDRIEHILTDSQASILITDPNNNFMIQDWTNGHRVLLNVDEPDSHVDDSDLGLSITPASYAEISYTSGSTGTAKGAVKSHRSKLRTVMNFTNACHICVDDRAAVFGRGPVGKHVLNALLNGATYYFLEFGDKQLLRLAAWLNQEKITLFSSLPTAFRHLTTDLIEGEGFPNLRLIRLSGEPLVKSDVELYKKHFSSACMLVNTYAAQETGDVCFYFVDKHSAISTNRVPVGYAAEGMEILLHDQLGNKLGVDVPGEIVVRSRVLPAGYWRNGSVTSEYRPALSNEADERECHTGDIGELSADGCLTHFGRKDSIVKIRTFRVDIGEVEATLAGHPAVKQTAVISTEHVSGDTRLVAYYVPTGHAKPTMTSLRKFLIDRLPEYMVPSYFVCLDKFPLTATGKVARRVLPAPGNHRPNLDSRYVSPQTPNEVNLERIWTDVLCLDQVGIHDNFFELGGHSLAATRVVSRVIQQFQLEIPLQSLFQSPTIAEMAAVIAEHQGKMLDESQLSAILDELASLSDAEAQRLVSESNSTNTKN